MKNKSEISLPTWYDRYLIEESKQFELFLIAFWVRWIIEYLWFSDWEKDICLKEYLFRKELGSFVSVW